MINTLDLKYLLEDIEQNDEYENYLVEHIGNVKRGYEWIKTNLPNIVSQDNYVEETAYYGELDEIIAQHDRSKYNRTPDVETYYELCCEYDAYARYFYGPEKTEEVKEAFDRAWLAHIHANPHHWQHWMLQNDEEGLKLIDMPYVFIIEMICDWWAFSWKSGNLSEIFDWYNKHKDGIIVSDKTRTTLESILQQLEENLPS